MSTPATTQSPSAVAVVRRNRRRGRLALDSGANAVAGPDRPRGRPALDSRWNGARGQRGTGPAMAAVGAAVAGGVGLARWLLPVSPLPRPTGPHPVGTTVTMVPGRRSLPVQVWYPAAGPTGGSGRPALLFPSPQAPAVIAGRYGLPGWLLAPLGRIRGHAIEDVPAIDGMATSGVAVLIHGWLGFRTIHADLAEQMASDGWVVLAADHVGGALVTQFPDGRTSGVVEELMPPTGAPDYAPRSLALVDRYAQDVTAVLDVISAGLSLPHVGLEVPPSEGTLLIGQSTGGGAAVRTAARDRRVAAIVGLDPWVEPVRRRDRQAVTCPMIAIRSGTWVGNANDRLLAAMPTVRLRVVAQAGHSDLTALGYLTPLTRLTGLSRCHPSLPHDATMAAIAEVTVAVSAR